MYDTLLEIVGYVASAIVLVSFFMSSVTRLRLVNLVGAALFAIYACLTHTYPTALMNLCIVLVDIYYLVRLSRRNARYTVLPTEVHDPHLQAFLAFHGDHLRRVFPDLEQALALADTLCLTYCDLTPAGLLLGKGTAHGTLEVLVEYNIPAHRDGYTSRALYAALPGMGIRRLVWHGVSQSRAKQLKKLGCSQENGRWVMVL